MIFKKLSQRRLPLDMNTVANAVTREHARSRFSTLRKTVAALRFATDEAGRGK